MIRRCTCSGYSRRGTGPHKPNGTCLWRALGDPHREPPPNPRRDHPRRQSARPWPGAEVQGVRSGPDREESCHRKPHLRHARRSYWAASQEPAPHASRMLPQRSRSRWALPPLRHRRLAFARGVSRVRASVDHGVCGYNMSTDGPLRSKRADIPKSFTDACSDIFYEDAVARDQERRDGSCDRISCGFCLDVSCTQGACRVTEGKSNKVSP